MKLILGKFYRHLAIFYWSHCTQCFHFFGGVGRADEEKSFFDRSWNRYNKHFFRWAIPGIFFFIFVFLLQFTVYKYSIWKFADGWIRTTDLWCRKQPLFQLNHNHCQIINKFWHRVTALRWILQVTWLLLINQSALFKLGIVNLYYNIGSWLSYVNVDPAPLDVFQSQYGLWCAI